MELRGASSRIVAITRSSAQSYSSPLHRYITLWAYIACCTCEPVHASPTMPCSLLTGRGARKRGVVRPEHVSEIT
eukprot:1084622-Prymnesium_polylepis.1